MEGELLRKIITLNRPLVWVDVETADIAPSPDQAHICEIGFRLIYPDDKPDKLWGSYINPCMPIDPYLTREVHKIKNEDVTAENVPTFAQIAPSLAKGFRGCDFGGYNVKFDLRAISGEMQRAKVEWTYSGAYLVDPLRIWQEMEPRRLGNAMERFCGRAATDAHRAETDATDAYDVFLGQLKVWEGIPRDIKKIGEMCFPKDPTWLDEEGKFRWKNNVCCISFGKHSGTPIQKVNKGYLQWIVNDSGLFSDAKRIAREALDGKYPSPQQEMNYGQEAGPEIPRDDNEGQGR